MAFFIFSFLDDRWDTYTGAYMGKDWANIEYLFKLYSVEEPKVILYILKLYEGLSY